MSERVGRRAWLRGLLPKAADAVAEGVQQKVDQRFPRQRRPPGSSNEAVFLTLCTRCDKCVDACDYGAIFTFTDDAGPVLAGTPVMSPDQRACHMCEGFPCVKACEDEALLMPKTATWNLGSVTIDSSRCIAFLGPECGACVKRCPSETQAITQQNWKPVLDKAACFGCGVCIDACPMMPAAITLDDLPA